MNLGKGSSHRTLIGCIQDERLCKYTKLNPFPGEFKSKDKKIWNVFLFNQQYLDTVLRSDAMCLYCTVIYLR